MPFCYKKMEDGEPWRHKLCRCSGYTRLCCRSYWCPCWILGKVAQDVDEPCCPCACFGLLGFVGCWAGMRVRGRVREKYTIQGSWQKDCAMAYFCGCCALLQLAQEVEDHRLEGPIKRQERREHKDADKRELTKETTLDSIKPDDDDEIYY